MLQLGAVFCRLRSGVAVGYNMPGRTDTGIGGGGACIYGDFTVQKLIGGVAYENCHRQEPKTVRKPASQNIRN